MRESAHGLNEGLEHRDVKMRTAIKNTPFPLRNPKISALYSRWVVLNFSPGRNHACGTGAQSFRTTRLSKRPSPFRISYQNRQSLYRCRRPCPLISETIPQTYRKTRQIKQQLAVPKQEECRGSHKISSTLTNMTPKCTSNLLQRSDCIGCN